MCGRAVTGEVTWQKYHDWMQILQVPDEDLVANYNVTPTSINPIFIPSNDEALGVTARWGLVPHWWKKPVKEMKFTTFNARAEEAADKPVFRDAFRTHHCLIPVQGYYEWTGSKGNKTPYFIDVNTNAPAFCFAGLYSEVSLPDYTGYTYTVLTEPSNGVIKPLHHRMPVMLDEGGYVDWLAAKTALADLPRVDGVRLRFHEVDKAVGNVRNAGKSLIEPVGLI